MIRKATVDDLPVIAGLWEKMCLESRPEVTPDKELWLEMGRQLFSVDSLGFTIIVAETDDKKIIGFASGMVYREPSIGKIVALGQHFFVLPGWRNGYTPAMLYKEIVSCAVLRYADVIEFPCMPEKIKFWQKHGFHIDKINMVRHLRE